MLKIISINLLIVVLLQTAFAQKKYRAKKDTSAQFLLESDTIPDLEFQLSQEEQNLVDNQEIQVKKKNRTKKKKTYFGIKTKRGFARKDDENIEIFRLIGSELILKNTYQRDIYYYDIKNKRIKSDNYNDLTAKVKKGLQIYILHGPYQRYRNREVRERGFFYKGTKHGKWEEFDGNGILLEKVKYELGWLADSKIIYYDEEEKQIKEVIPMLHGRIQGKYYLFYDNGVTAIEGKYENNQKVELWREFYKNRQRKTDTQYPIRWYEKKEPVKLREWNTNGQLIWDIDRGGKVKN